MSDSREDDKILILVVDRDDDVGEKTGLPTPIVGRNENLKAATSLAIADPEEADANAMFSGVALYDELLAKLPADNLQIATVAGSVSEDYNADLKLSSEIDGVLQAFKAQKCILVTDGFADREILPIISSRLPVASIRRVIIRHSGSVEETWAVLGKYLKRAFTDARYSRVLVGAPGIFVLLIGLFMVIGVANLPVVVSLLGLALIVRGFNIDGVLLDLARRLTDYSKKGPTIQIRLLATLAAIVVFLVGIYQGMVGVGREAADIALQTPSIGTVFDNPVGWIVQVPRLAGSQINNSVDLLAISILILVFGNGMYYLLVKHPRFWRMIQGTVLTVWLWAILRSAGIILQRGALGGGVFNPRILELLSTIGVGLLIVPLIITFTRLLRRRYSWYFRRQR